MDQLYLIEVLVDKLNFNHEVEPVPQKKQLSIFVTFGNFAVLEIRSDGLSTDIPEKSSSKKREVEFNSGKSYLFPSKAEDLINALNVCPLEISVSLKNSPKPIGVATISWDMEFTDMVQSSMDSAGYITPASMKDVVPLRQKASSEPVGNIDISVRLSCFGKSIQTQFQVIPAKENIETPTQFLFKSTNTGTTFQCQRYGMGLSSELLPIAPIVNYTEIGAKKGAAADQPWEKTLLEERDFDPSESICPSGFSIAISPVSTQQKLELLKDIKLLKKELTSEASTIQSLCGRPDEHKFTNVLNLLEDVASIPNISISTVMDTFVKEEEMTAEKISKTLCKSRDCPGVQKFKEYGIGPLATGKGLGTVFGTPPTANVPYGISNTYGNLDTYGPFGVLLNPVDKKKRSVSAEDNRLSGGGGEEDLDTYSKSDVSSTKDPCIQQMRTLRKVINDESCKKLLEGFDKVLNSYKRSLGPCGKPTCPLAQNILDCSKLCHGEFTEGVKNDCDCDELNKPGLREEFSPGDPVCGQRNCPYFHKEKTIVDDDFITPPTAKDCGNRTCPFKDGSLIKPLELLLTPPPYGSLRCGSPLCQVPKRKKEKELQPIHWECDDPLPKGPCTNPDCPIEKEKRQKAPSPTVSRSCYIPHPQCYKSPPQKCFPSPQKCFPPPPQQCFPPPPKCYLSPPASCVSSHSRKKSHKTSKKSSAKERCCGGGSVTECGVPAPPQICSYPTCPLNMPPKSCYVTVGPCGSFDCPYKSEKPPCCGDPGVEPCMDPSCPFTPIAKCGNPGCPYKEIPKPRSCSNPTCPTNPQPVSPCGIPVCPYAGTQFDDYCGNPDCPFSPNPGSSQCPYSQQPPPVEFCGNPKCPFKPPEQPPCGNLECPFAEVKQSGICGKPKCPFKSRDTSPCGNPQCPFAEPKQSDICGKPKCPFKPRDTSPCGNPECPFAEPKQSDICSNPKCPFKSKDTSPCGNPECPFAETKHNDICYKPKCPFKPRSTSPCGNPECPFAEEKQNDICGNPKCPFKPQTTSHCGNPECPFAEQKQNDICGNPKCPFKPRSTSPCGNPECPFEEEKQSDFCGNPKCPFKPRSTSPCGNPECPFEEEKQSDFCGNPNCPFKPEDASPCGSPKCPFKPQGNTLCGNPDCPFNPPMPTSGGDHSKTCNIPSCPFKKPSCFDPQISPCGDPNCPLTPPFPPSCDDPTMEPCLDPSCPFTPKPICGNPGCPFIHDAKPSCFAPPVSPCGDPNCPFTPQYGPLPPSCDDPTVEPCMDPSCPFTPKPLCGNPGCPFNPKPPSCPFNPSTCPFNPPTCPFNPPTCPFNQTPTCPFSAGDSTVCDGPICPFSKEQVCLFSEEGMKEREQEEDDKISCHENREPCRKSTCKWLNEYVKCSKCKGLSKSGATCDNPNPNKNASGVLHTDEQIPEGKTDEHKKPQHKESDKNISKAKKKKANTEPKNGKSDSAIKGNKDGMKLPPTSHSDKGIASKGKTDDDGKDKKKKRSKFVYDCGDEYPGVKIGHRDCIAKRQYTIPMNMGWLWNCRQPLGKLKPRGTGWRPGAMSKVISERIRKHREAHGCEMLNLFGKFVGKKSKKPLHASNSNISIPDKPTLHVKKKKGIYLITMNPLKDPHARKLEENESPYLDCTPMQFKIVKNKDKLTLLNGEEGEEALKNCMCGVDEDEDDGSKSSESELEIEFTPPAGIIHPEMRKKKHSVVHTDTQYDPKDCILPKKKDSKHHHGKGKGKKGKGKGKGKGGKGKGGKGGKGKKK